MTSSPSISNAGNWQRPVEIAFLFLLFFIVGGEPPPGINEAQYLSKAKHFWNPNWCADDHFLSSADAHYVFYWTVGLLTKWLSLEATSWVGRSIGWLFLAVGWQRLSWHIVPRFGASILSAGIWHALTFRCHMSGEWVIGGIEGKVIAYGFVLLGITDLVQNRWKWVWIWFGLASSFHVLVGGWSVLAALFAWTISPRTQRMSLPGMFPFLILGGILALPGLIPVLLLSRGLDSQIVSEGARVYVFDRLQHHLVLRSFAPSFIARFAIMTLAWFLISIGFRTSGRYDRAFRFVIGTVLITGIGAIVDFGINDPTTAAGMLRFYWFRLSDVAVPLGVSLLAIDVLQQRLSFLGFSKTARGLKSHELQMATQPVGNRQKLIAVCLGTLSLVSLSEMLLNQSSRAIPGADRQGPIASTYRLAHWQEACQWMVENVDVGQPVFAPPNHQTFKWNTGHSELVNWKDIPQDPKGIVQWSERMSDVRAFLDSANTTPTIEKKLGLQKLAQKYNLRYFLVERRYQSLRNLPFPRVYENRSYTIYDIGQR